jgi:hypothetical protein
VYCNVSKPHHLVQPKDLAQCNYPALMEHWEKAGRREGRTLDCAPLANSGVGRRRSATAPQPAETSLAGSRRFVYRGLGHKMWGIR